MDNTGHETNMCAYVYTCVFLGGVITGFGIVSAGRNLVVETCVLELVGDGALRLFLFLKLASPSLSEHVVA